MKIHYSCSTIYAPKRYVSAQIIWVLLLTASLALIALRGVFARQWGYSPSLIKRVGLTAVGAFTLSALLTHLFWERKAPKKLPCPTTTKPNPRYLLELMQAHHIRVNKMGVLSHDQDASKSYGVVPLEEYFISVPEYTPLIRFPTTVCATYAVRYTPEELSESQKAQALDLEQLYYYQYVKGDGNCLFTAYTTGLLHQLLALLMTQPEEGKAAISTLKRKMSTALPDGTFECPVQGQSTFIGKLSLLHQLFDSLAKTPTAGHLGDLLRDRALIENCTAFFRFHSSKSEFMTASSPLYENADNEALLALQEFYPSVVILKCAPEQPWDTSQLPAEKEGITLFYAGDHFDALIPKAVMQTLTKK